MTNLEYIKMSNEKIIEAVVKQLVAEGVLKEDRDQVEEDFSYEAKLFGESRSVTYRTDEALVMCTEWANGEGYDFAIEEGENTKNFSLKMCSIDTMLSCLKHLGFLKSYKL